MALNTTQKKIIKLLLLIIVLVGGFTATYHICHKATDGFAVVNIITPKHKPFKDRHLPLSEEKRQFLNALFNQTFTYLNCGAQCYVFESEDKQYVIKFFKYHHMRILPWLQHIPLPSFLGEWKRQKLLKKNKEIDANLDSYFLAMQFLSKETGLIYVHLNKTDFWERALKIKDKLGIVHFIDLDKVDFLIQKKGILVADALQKWTKQGELEQAKNGIKKLLSLIKKRCLSGLGDKDPNLLTNFGFLENGDPFQLDIGRFYLDLSKKQPNLYNEEIIKIMHPFQEWILKNHPFLSEKINDEQEI